MTAAQIQKLYPGNQVARLAASALADDRMGERRAGMSPAMALPYGVGYSLGAPREMPEQRTMFEQALIKAMNVRQPYTVGMNLTYLTKGAFNDAGDWVYEYYNVQCSWEGYLMCLQVHGVVLK